MKLNILLLIPSLFIATSFAQHPGETQQEFGTGTRAAALANNHVALTSGIADLYWNPAALGFYVSREFQGSLYGFKQSSASEFFDKTTDEDIQRFKLSEAGFAFALPTSRGGLSLAASYSNPVILDDVLGFSGHYEYDSNDSLVTVNRVDRVTGNLHFWTIGFGVQVANNFALGIAPSIITGKARSTYDFEKEVDFQQIVYDEMNNSTVNSDYLGFDLRIGMMFKTPLFNIGTRMVFPQIIRNNNEVEQIYLDDLNDVYETEYYDYTERYIMYSSYKGAIGASFMLPQCTVTGEIRGTLPYDYVFPEKKIPSGTQSGHFKTGAGIGIEAPVVVMPLLVRVGYSYDVLDLHPYVFDFAPRYNDNIDIDFSDYGLKVNRDLHRISAGIGYTASTVSYDLSYVFSTWGITTNTNLKQTYMLHRVATTVSIRF